MPGYGVDSALCYLAGIDYCLDFKFLDGLNDWLANEFGYAAGSTSWSGHLMRIASIDGGCEEAKVMRVFDLVATYLEAKHKLKLSALCL
jgi:hypothetical protein